MSAADAAPEGYDPAEEDRPRITDKRRIDPETGALRTTAAPQYAAPPEEPAPAGGAAGELEAALAERTADLQRVTAEFANYRKRVERDRVAVAEQALASVLIGLLPVLDDIERAREHGELVGGFQKVAEGLETTLAKLGLSAFGEAGEPFDPTRHEALTHSVSAEVTETTSVAVLAKGYRLGERILRPARVAVAEPAEPAEPAKPAEPGEGRTDEE